VNTTLNKWAVAIALGLASAVACAGDVEIKAPWVRGTVAGQQATGAFMELSSRDGATLVGASSPVAGAVEIHEMRMEGNIMKMRQIPRLELPAGKPLTLGPGGYHVMLLNLKQPLRKGDTVPLTLQIEGSDKKVETLQIAAPVRDLTAATNEHKH